MKAFIAGLITLASLIAAVTFNGFFVHQKIETLLAQTQALSEEAISADATKLSDTWDASSPWIALSVSRLTVDEIEDTISLLLSDIKTGNETGYLVSRTKLICLFKRLQETESFNLRRIF